MTRLSKGYSESMIASGARTPRGTRPEVRATGAPKSVTVVWYSSVAHRHYRRQGRRDGDVWRFGIIPPTAVTVQVVVTGQTGVWECAL